MYYSRLPHYIKTWRCSTIWCVHIASLLATPVQPSAPPLGSSWVNTATELLQQLVAVLSPWLLNVSYTFFNAFIINYAILVVTVVTNHPTSNTVTNIAHDAILSNITSCTTVEATTLKGQFAKIESAEKKIASMLNSTQSALLGEHTFHLSDVSMFLSAKQTYKP